MSSFFYFFNDGRIFAILIFLASSCFFCFLSEDLERLHDENRGQREILQSATLFAILLFLGFYFLTRTINAFFTLNE